MSKPSELALSLQRGITELMLIPKDRLDGYLLDKVESELRDAERLLWEAVWAAQEGERWRAALDRSG